MSARVILCFVLVSIVCSCKNEPYDEKPLAVIGLLNHATTTNYSFNYRNQKLNSFLSVKTSDTLARMKFYYSGDQLTSIVSDSTKTSWKITSFYGTGSNIVVDSTFLFADGTRTITSVRTITYNPAGFPDAVSMTTWTAGVVSGERAELTWNGDNVVRLITYNTSTGADVLISDLAIGHDSKPSVYMRNPVYLFTLALKDYYWLSANNPVVFNYGDGDGEKKYTYWYNRMGYPSNFKTETNVLFGASYTQVR